MRPAPPATLLACALLSVAGCASTAVGDAGTGMRDAAAGASATPASDPASVGPVVAVPQIARPQGETAQWWYTSGAAHAARNGAMSGSAHNVIVFLGDGMSLTTVAAARILAGQREGKPGEEHLLAWEHFPHTALARTYNVDAQTPDSAGTMTAIASGVKTRAGVLGIGPAALRGDCAASVDARLASLLDIAQGAGLRTGIVTTTRITHATPAAMYAHSPDRNWENDGQLPPEALADGCRDIASQLVDPRSGRVPDVVFGGGRMHFLPLTQVDPEYADRRGRRADGRDLIAEWRTAHPGGAFVWNRDGLAAAAGRSPVLGLFEYDHLHYEHDRPADPGEPSLAELTTAAIARLSGGDTGYLLLVEAGRIDHAHHEGNAYRALTDTIAMSDAVAAAMAATSDTDTLVLVTADHAHTLTFAGYPIRGNPILGKVVGSSGEEADPDAYARDGTGLPYTTLGYANGPGHVGPSASQPAGPKHHLHRARDQQPATGRADLTAIDTTDPDYLQEATVPLASESHGGDDVGVWASGPGSAAVRGSLEQHVLYHVLVQATPRLRARLCAIGGCNGDGVPVLLSTAGDASGAAPVGATRDVVRPAAPR